MQPLNFLDIQAAEPEKDQGEGDAQEAERAEMHRTLSGRYKNPVTDNTQPFGIGSRPSQPLASRNRGACRLQRLTF